MHPVAVPDGVIDEELLAVQYQASTDHARPPMMWHGGWGMGGGFGMIIFWILGILAVVWIVRELGAGKIFPRSGDERNAPSQDSALTVLRERYARGEIDDEEFERRNRNL